MPNVSDEITSVDERVITVHFTGTLTKSDLERAQAVAVEAIRKHGKVRILVIAIGFLGWDREGKWGDVSFPSMHDPQIEKIGVVGDKRWEDVVLAFMGKGLRPVKIEYFPPDDVAKAHAGIRE